MSEKKVKQLIASHKAIIFSKTYCPYCKKAKQAFKRSTNFVPFVVELDLQADGGSAYQSALEKITGRSSVPSVFVNGKFIGGGDDTVAKAESGKLKQLLVSFRQSKLHTKKKIFRKNKANKSNKLIKQTRRHIMQRGGANITIKYTHNSIKQTININATNFGELLGKFKEHLITLDPPRFFHKFLDSSHLQNNSPLNVDTTFVADTFIKMMPQLLFNDLIGKDIGRLCKTKPVANLNSGQDTDFNRQWPIYTDVEKKFILNKLCTKIGYEVAIEYVGHGSAYVFYSVPHLTLLCNLFDDKSIDECFQKYIKDGPGQPPSEAFDFIFLAFGDIFKAEGDTDKKTKDDLTQPGKLKFDTYISYTDDLFGPKNVCGVGVNPGGGGGGGGSTASK